MNLDTTAGRIVVNSNRGRFGALYLLTRWFSLLLLLLGSGYGMAQTDSPSEYQVKAAFLYNFGKFIEWPDSTFTNSQAAFVIGIFGSDPFQGDLDRIVAGKTINGHPVVARLISSVSNLKGCNIIFVSAAQAKKAAEISQALAGANVLTVTENMKHFSGSGFMINFVVQDEHIAFQINHDAATHAGLSISSKLLSLARPME